VGRCSRIGVHGGCEFARESRKDATLPMQSTVPQTQSTFI
jgi:hypothetical protein